MVSGSILKLPTNKTFCQSIICHIFVNTIVGNLLCRRYFVSNKPNFYNIILLQNRPYNLLPITKAIENRHFKHVYLGTIILHLQTWKIKINEADMLCTCQTFKSPHVLSSLMIFKFKTRIDVKKMWNILKKGFKCWHKSKVCFDICPSGITPCLPPWVVT